MEVQRAIQDATTACLEAFAECQAVDQLRSNGWADHRLADFTLWASGTGALARQKASLDHRLAARPDVLELIASMLRVLCLAVKDCIELGADLVYQ